MKTWDIIRTANANLFRNKARSILTILAIFVGSFTIILTTGINYGVTDYTNKQMANVGAEGYLEVMKTSLDPSNVELNMGASGPVEYDPNKAPLIAAMTPADIETMRQVGGVEAARGMYETPVRYIASNQTDKKYEIAIQSYLSDRLHIDMATGSLVNNETDEFQIMLAPDFAAALGYDDASIIGQTITLGVPITQLAEGAPEKTAPIELVVTGVQNKSVVSMGRSWVNRAASEAIYNLSLSDVPDQYRPAAPFYFAIVELARDASDEQINQVKEQLKDAGFAAMTIADSVNMMLSVFDAITIILMIFGAIALLAASIGIINTLYMAVQERTREIGLMKAMGLSSGKIFLMFSVEAIMLGFWGSVVGILLAFAARAGINTIAAQTFLAELPGFVPVQFNLLALVVVTLLIMAIAFLAGTLPARRAARQNPIDALRYE